MGCRKQRKSIKGPDSRRKEPMIEVATKATESRGHPKSKMTLSGTEHSCRTTLLGEAYLVEDVKSLEEVPKAVSVVLHDNGFDLYSCSEDGDEVHQAIAYSETLIRCSLNQIPASAKPYVIQLEAGLRTIFICFAIRDERDGCFTKILASVGQFLVLNPRSRKTLVKKKTSNPLSPVSPLSLSAWPSTKHFQLSSLLNALDISSPPCISSSRPHNTFSFRVPTMLVSLCNAKPRRAQPKDATSAGKKPVARSYTLPFSKHSTSISCKQYSARNMLVNEHSTRSSLETRAALGILNIDSGDMRPYLARL